MLNQTARRPSAQLLAFAALLASPAAAQDTADYTVTLDAVWNADSHPDAFPNLAHFSPFVGAVHDDTFGFWEPGTLASNGMEDMAEDGETAFLSIQILQARNQGRATHLLDGPFLFAGEAGGESFTAEPTHTLLSVVSMIAPSPDWFVGVNSINLRPDGQWINRAEIELYVYDAGTDNGTAFTSPNSDTQPPELMRNVHNDPVLAEPPFAGTPHVAVLVIERTDAPCLADTNADGILNGADFNAWLAAFGSGDPAADQNQDGTLDGSDFNAWLANFAAGCE